ncbi:hypothetical protein [Mucilaginibacter sp. SJ]|uniref:hypothetical protein n=1 Tax=Mucilaginibacter sp. SJ TaxID=3029053 RepID=UPI0023A9FF51|nr:hypothetical protein [Mucilaginibacter sp. SJ]WEA00184.1 hypothetical protein MusilaSJ_22260 [Mucilaginibacter sp. SJ]
MTTLIITVDDERTESLKKILKDIPYVRDITVKSSDMVIKEPTQLDKIKATLNASKGKDFFQDIKDPVEWQRNIRGYCN